MTLSSVNLDFSCKLDISAFLQTALTASYVLIKDHILLCDGDIAVLDVLLLLLHLPPPKIADDQDDHHEDTGDNAEDATSSHDDRKDD